MSRKAFIIGANTLGLKHAESDADLMRECLGKYEYSIISPPKKKNDIMPKFDDFIDETTKLDLIVFYFSGHGHIIKGKLFLVIDDSLKSKNLISITSIIELIEQSRAKDKLIILDCCNSGTSAVDWDLEQPDRYRILTSSERLEKSKELDAYKAGFLTYYFHKAIMSCASKVAGREGKIRINELHNWLEIQAREHNSKPNALTVPIPNLFGNNKANFEIAEIPQPDFSDRSVDPNSFSLDTLCSTSEKIIQEQIKAVGHDKYIPSLYVNRKIEKEIESFINFEETFLDRANVILDDLISIAHDYRLGEISLACLSKAKITIIQIDTFTEYSILIDELKEIFYFEDVENILKLIYSTIIEHDSIKFHFGVKNIISKLKKLPYISESVTSSVPNILLEAKYATKLKGKKASYNDNFLNDTKKLFPVKRTIISPTSEIIELANDFIKEFIVQIQFQTQRCVTLVSKAGYGKTNTMCRIAEQLAKSHPTILLSGQMAVSSEYDIEFHIQRRIEAETHKIPSDWVSLIAPELKNNNKWLIVFIDGINENSNLSLFIRMLRNFLPKIENKRIKLILSCRDMFWELFSTTLNPYLFQDKPISLNEFSDTEWDFASKGYFTHYNITCKLDKQAKFALKNPLLLRFFCEVYTNNDLDEVSNVQLLSVFDLYLKRLSSNIAERFGSLRADPVVEFLLKVGHEMWKTKTTSVSFSTLGITPEEADMTTSVYNLVRAENIILEESWHRYATHKTIRFVYDEFMEYIIARSWANQYFISKITEKSTEFLLQEAVNSISSFSPAFGSILFLDKMLEQGGVLVNRAISLIDSTNDIFMASRQITMLYAFENMDVNSIDDNVLVALDKFEKTARDEIRERLAHVILKIFKNQTAHQILRNIVKRILEIGFGNTSNLAVAQNELRAKLDITESNKIPLQKKMEDDLRGLPPGRYHYTQETKLNAISILVASKNLEDYSIIEKGIRNIGKMDVHNALHALASLDFAPQELVYKTISKYLDKDYQPLPEYKIYCAWLLRERYGNFPAEYLTRLLTDNETRVHRYAFSLFKQRLIENELIESVIQETQKEPRLSSWHLSNLILLINKKSQFSHGNALTKFGEKIATTLNLLRYYPQASLRLEIYRALINYKEFIDFDDLVKDMKKDADKYIRTIAQKIIA